MKNNLLPNILLSFISSAVAFIFVSLFMISQSLKDYNFLDTETFFKSAIFFTILFGLLLCIINVILYLFKLNKLAIYISYFMLSWIMISGFILPVSTSTGMVDPESNPIDFFHLTIVFICSTILAKISLTVFRNNIQIFFLILFLVSVIPANILIYHSDILKSFTSEESLILSKERNILVISFDGMQGESVENVIKGNKFFLNELKDFILFENAVSQAPATEASLIGDIYGIQDYKAKGKDIPSVINALENEGFNNFLPAKHILDTYQYGYPGYGMKTINIIDPVVKIQQKKDSFDFFKYVIIRIFTKEVLVNIDWKTNILPLSKCLIKVNDSIEVIEKLKNHNGPDWDKGNILTLGLFNSFISNIASGNKDFSLRYLHFTFTHFPVDYDDKCNYRSDDKIWFDKNQNEEGIHNQNICAITKFTEFIQELKKLGIYDKSLIIFKSDHGERSDYFSKFPYNLQINEHPYWGYSRYRPMLMIKDFESNSYKITFKSELVLLNDIAKTVCERSYMNLDCKIFSGINLFENSLENNSPYFIYVVKNKEASFSYDDHISVKIPSRNISLLEAMKNSHLVFLTEPK